jgi:hypothetical protein
VLDYLAEILKKQDQDHNDTTAYIHIIETMSNLYPDKHADLLYEIIDRRIESKQDSKRMLAELLEQGLEMTLQLSRSYVEKSRNPDDIHERLLMNDDDDCCNCGHEHHHGHHHHHNSKTTKPQKHALPKNQRVKNKKKGRANQRQARKKNRRK